MKIKLHEIELDAKDPEASKRFYRAIFAALGKPDVLQEGAGFFYADELFVNVAHEYVTRGHLAFQAPDQETVRAFYKAALSAGGRDNGPPGERSYHLPWKPPSRLLRITLINHRLHLVLHVK